MFFCFSSELPNAKTDDVQKCAITSLTFSIFQMNPDALMWIKKKIVMLHNFLDKTVALGFEADHNTHPIIY